MNILTNAGFPSSEKITLHYFGPKAAEGLQYDYVRPFPEFLAEVRTRQPVDAVFLYYPEYNFIPPALEEAEVPLFGFISDWNLGYFPLRRNAGRFDTLVTDKGGCRHFQAMGFPSVLHWNMYGFQPAVYENPPEASKEWDILFVGNVNPYVQKARGRLLKRILDLSDRFRVRLETGVFGQDYVRALRSAKIVFNRSIRGEANMRVFEALASDSLVFLESGNEEIRDYLDEGSECVLYDERSLETALEYWITHDEEREKVVQKASQKKGRYSYPAMLDRLHNLIVERDLLKSSRTDRLFPKLPANARRYHAVLQAFFSAGQPADPGFVSRELHSFLRTADNGEQQGLFYLSLFHKVRNEGGLSANETSIARRLFSILSRQTRGRLFNHFNFAILMSELKEPEEALSVLRELRLLLGRPSIPEEEFAGAPCLFVNENYYQEINLFLYQGGPDALDALRKLLLNLCLTRMAILLNERGEETEAASLLEEAVRTLDDNDMTFFLLGRAQLQQNPLVGYRNLRSAFALNPFLPQYWVDLLAACIALRRREEGLDFLGQISKIRHLSRKIFQNYSFEDFGALEARLLAL